MSERLVIVSNRGPAQFELNDDGEREVKRGGGGLVTALTGLVAKRDALWIASAMTEEDAEVERESGGEPIHIELDDVDYEVLLVESDPLAYDRFYNVIANPILWFIQHYLWDLSNAPDIRQEEADAWDEGYVVVNKDLADAVVADDRRRGRPTRDAPRLPPLHLPGAHPRGAPGRLPPALRAHPLVAGGLVARPARADARGHLSRHARERHHRLSHRTLTAGTSSTAAAT